MPRRLPPLNALRTFEAAARAPSFAAAAEELAVTPGAVSRQVKALEDWLGTRLFLRRHKQVSLTPEGRAYLEAIGGPFEAIAAATERLAADRRARPLAICSYPTFAIRWLLPRWARFYDRHPEIDVQLTTSLQPLDLANAPYDAAVQVSAEPAAWKGMRWLKLAEVALIPVCGPALAATLRRPADLARHTLLHGAPRPDDWARWLACAGVDGLDARAGPRFESLNLAFQAAIEGIGIAIAIRALVEDDLAAGRLLQPFGPARLSGRPFYLVWPEARTRDRRLRAFVDWLAREVSA